MVLHVCEATVQVQLLKRLRHHYYGWLEYAVRLLGIVFDFNEFGPQILWQL
jgi:hypothetical protein